MQKRFKTRSGYCHVHTDQIIITPFKYVKRMHESETKKKSFLFLAMLIFFILSLGYFTYRRYTHEEWLQVFVIGGTVLVFSLIAIDKIKQLNSKFIFRNTVKTIDFFYSEGDEDKINNYFIVYFESNGKKEHSIIMLPTTVGYKSKECEELIGIMEYMGPVVLIEKNRLQDFI